MGASPVYGEKMRKDGRQLKYSYDKYAENLSKILGCDTEKLQPLVHLFASAVLDYAVWDNRENTQMQLDFIYTALMQTVKNNCRVPKKCFA